MGPTDALEVEADIGVRLVETQDLVGFFDIVNGSAVDMSLKQTD